MAFDFASLEPLVTQILSAPDIDLATISAKRVRRELLALDSSLTSEFLKQNKLDVDAVITKVFGQVSGAQNADEEEEQEETGSSGTRKRKSTDDGEEEQESGDEGEREEEEEEEEESAPPPKKTKRAKKDQMSDAELARQISSELNGRSRRSTGKGKGTNGTPKKARPRKSAAAVASDGSDSEGGKKKKKKRAGGGAAKGGFAKEYALSTPLASLLQAEKLSRPQVVKGLWDYIKANDCQNPSNKREIVCDGNLRAVFNVDKIDMFRMNKVLGQHLHENEA